MIIHPASTTHRQLDEVQLRAAGAGPEVIRLSIGLETAADIIADLEQALAAAARETGRSAARPGSTFRASVAEVPSRAEAGVARSRANRKAEPAWFAPVFQLHLHVAVDDTQQAG